MKYAVLHLFIFLLTAISMEGKHSRTYLFAGNYTDGKPGKGIYIFSFNPKTGALTATGNAEGLTNPSFLTLSPDGRFIYACTDTRLPIEGSITAYAFDSIHGSLSLINKQPSGGENPVYITMHPDLPFVITANYNNSTAAVFTTGKDGSLLSYSQRIEFTGSSLHPTRQEKSHVHAAFFSPEPDYLFLPDLGSDKIRAFAFDNNSETPLTAADHLTLTTAPGGGPRHMAFHPDQPFAYCIEELSGMVSAYAYKEGKLDPIQRLSACAATKEVHSSADIHISPDGKFLYVSNRGDGENTIAIFSIDRGTGLLTLQGHQSTLGEIPRNFTISPDGKYLLVANQVSNTIVVFRIHRKTGLLTKTKNIVTVPGPSCLKMRVYGQ